MWDWFHGVSNFLPHGICYSWDKRLLSLHILSDALIALAYFSIPFVLWVFARRRTDLQFRSLFILFAFFILLCGLTHVMAIWVIWHPDYYLDGALKAATGIVSAFTAISLWPLLPRALKIPNPAALENLNTALREENDRRRQAEDELRRSNYELKKRVEELQALSYSISHDLRAPLRAIDGFSNILLRDHAGSLDQTGRNLLIRTEKAAARLGLSIDGLLHMTRIERIELESRNIDMRGLAEAAAAELKARYANVNFEIEALAPAYGDEELLGELWLQLLSNAAKFSSTREAPLVQVRSRQRGDKVFYEVRDNGVGYDDEFSGKLFGVFERLHGDEFEGLGLGLAMAKRIVERHGGIIEAETRLDAGAVFRFWIAPARAPSKV